MTDIFTKANLLAKTYSYSKSSYGGGLGVGAWLVWSFFYIASYAYLAICLMFVAKKTATSGGWMAWVPLLNLYLMCKVAGKSGLWIILLLLPFVNIVAIILLWAAIAERLGRPAWWGILMLIPIANIIIMGILAFSKGSVSAAEPEPAAVSPSSLKPEGTGGGLTCSECGAQASDSDKFCPDCGAKLIKKPPELKKEAAGKFCPGCGAKIKTADKFCPDCGAKL